MPETLLDRLKDHPLHLLFPADANALTRAGELARAFAVSSARPPSALVAELAAEASALAGRLRSKLAVPAPAARA